MKRTILNFTDFSLLESTTPDTHKKPDELYMEILQDTVGELFDYTTPININGMDYEFDNEPQSRAFMFLPQQIIGGINMMFVTPYWNSENYIMVEAYSEDHEEAIYENFVPITVPYRAYSLDDLKGESIDEDAEALYEFMLAVLTEEFKKIYISVVDKIDERELIGTFTLEFVEQLASLMPPERGAALLQRARTGIRSKKMFGI